MTLFKKRKARQTDAGLAYQMPGDLWQKCPKCGELIYNKDLERNLKVCTKCNAHLRLTARERIAMLLDEGSFDEFETGLKTQNPLKFPGYAEKLKSDQAKTGESETCLVGKARLARIPCVFAVTDFHFMAGSMASVVGEKIARSFEHAIELGLPLIAVSGSGGGARMQEGILSLMQMAKTASAVGKFNEAGLLYICVLTDPTMAGVYASWASLGDITIAEPGTMVGFTGPRLIQQNLNIKLPKELHTAEYQMQRGMIDLVVPRRDLKDTLARLLSCAGYTAAAEEA